MTSNFNVGDGSIWSGNLDGLVDLFKWGKDGLSSFYLLGGGGVHYFDKKNVTVTPLEPPTGGTTPGPATTYEAKSQTQFGVNGAGFNFAVGRTALFVESRYFSAFTNNANSDWNSNHLGGEVAVI